MKERVLIDYKNQKAGYNELVNLITDSNNKQIAIKDISITSDVLEQLETKFEDKLICFVEWSKILIIEDSIHTQFIKSHIKEFLQCFIIFDKTAHEMMDKMASTFKIDLSNPDQLWDLKRNKSKKQRGKVDSSWNYYFHGAECAFNNVRTNQYIDIKIIYGREYGVIDNFFLFRFIETTKSLSSQYKLLEGKSHNLRKVINVLKREGYLILRPNSEFEELILNRAKVKDYKALDIL